MKKRILIVDDDEEICDELSEILVSERFQVETVYDGLKASQLLDKGLYDLVLLDLKLPGLSGFELLSRIRKNKIAARVLVLSGRPFLNKRAFKELSSVNGEEESILKLADGIINKPFRVEQLLHKIKELLR